MTTALTRPAASSSASPTASPSPSPAALGAATPTHRDRYVDFLRAFSLAVVVLGHWLMAVVVYRGGRVSATNVLESSPWAHWLTWLFQVMPLFFVVGGFSNTASLAAARRDGVPYGAWLGSRLARLVRPVLVFALVWTGAAGALWLAGVDPAAVRGGSIAQPLWFLSVYVGVVALAPAMVDAQRRWGMGFVVALGVTVAAVDLLRWPLGVPVVGWVNLAVVWIFAHQLGIAWRSAPARPTRRAGLATAALGLAGVAVLSMLLGYSNSMVGGAGEVRSNTFPPSLALVFLALFQLGAALALRAPVDRWLVRPRVWTGVVAANGLAMTLYLWHLTALLIVSVAVLPRGWWTGATAGSAGWWLWRPLWVALLSAALVPLVVVFARVERRRLQPGRAPAPRVVIATIAVAAGMGLLARKGFADAATLAAALGLLAVGWRLLWSGVPA